MPFFGRSTQLTSVPSEHVRVQRAIQDPHRGFVPQFIQTRETKRNPMRIAIVSAYDPAPTNWPQDHAYVGGVERVLFNIAQRLSTRGQEVTLVCSTGGPSGDDEEHGLRVVREHRRGSLLGAPLVGLAKRIPSDAQLVHVAATYPFTTPAVLRRARQLGVPSVLDFHFEPHPPSPVGRVAATVYRGVGPRSYSLATVALVRSLAYARRARSLGSVPEARWRVVPNGIDPTVFRPEGAARAGDYILFVGRLVPYKGVAVLLRALALEQDPPPLLIVGTGPQEAPLKALAACLGVDATFLGRVPDPVLPSLYRGARLTVLPSVAPQECFGITLLESMACGTPVVASALPGMDGVALMGGLLAAPGSAESLRNQIRAALERPDIPSGPALASRIHKGYSWDAITTRVLGVYEDLMHGSQDDPEVMVAAHPGRNPVL